VSRQTAINDGDARAATADRLSRPAILGNIEWNLPRHGLSDAPQLSLHPKRLVLSKSVHTPAAKGSGGSEMICGSVIKAHQVSLSTSPQGSRRTNHCGSNYFCQLQSASSITIGETLSWADRSAANISSAFGDRVPLCWSTDFSFRPLEATL